MRPGPAPADCGHRSALPVLILTASDLEADQVLGLELGADDYVTKPCSLAVLRARVNRLLRRARTRRRGAGAAPLCSLTLGGWSTSGKACRWTCPRRSSGCCGCWRSTGGRPSPGSCCWPGCGTGGEFVDENALSVAVNRLRRKLGEAPIRTVYGVGYVWAEG